MRYAVIGLLVAGCTAPNPGVGDDAGADLAEPGDLAAGGCTRDTDCKGSRICENGKCVEPPDAAQPADLATGPDLTPPADLAPGADLAPAADLAELPDLSRPDLAQPDLVAGPDLLPAPDLAPAADLAGPADLAPGPDLCACPPIANGVGYCTNGGCAPMCDVGFADCNNKVGDGCEADLRFDATNCGGCGKACPAPANATTTCAASMCGFTCKAGFGNCDNQAANGCESPLSTDKNNCGSCGKTCSNNNIAPSCAAGVCSGACNFGFSDCDGNKQTNGCETNTWADAKNCGKCGNACLNGRTCVNGVCQ